MMENPTDPGQLILQGVDTMACSSGVPDPGDRQIGLVEALPGEGDQARLVQLFRQARLRLLIGGDAARRDAPRDVSDDRARHMDRQLGGGPQARDRLTLVAVRGYQVQQAKVDAVLLPELVPEPVERPLVHRPSSAEVRETALTPHSTTKAVARLDGLTPRGYR